MNEQNPKFDLKHETQDLKVFFYTVQGGPMLVEFPEDFKAVMAYNESGAVENIRKDYPAGVVISARKRGEVTVKRIVDAINLKMEGQSQELQIHVEPKISREKTAIDFIHGLMLVADKFVTNKRDQATLKRIIGSIKPNA